MKRYAFVAIVGVLAIAAVGGIAAAESGPLADAGLDQEVGVNTTVQLDGTGSSHPDGTIDGYEWSIETPAGARTTPACTDCGRTSFRPTEPGRYNVTVIVTDSEGRSEADTLYVYVKDYGPTVRLDGDTDPRTGERAPYEASVEADGFELEELTWLIDGGTVATDALSGSEATERRSIGFSGSGSYRLTVVATDTTGRSDRDVLVVEPRTDRELQPSSGDEIEAAEPAGTIITGDVDCKVNQQIAQAGYACIGNQNALADDTITGGYMAACEKTVCAKSSTVETRSGVDANTAGRFAENRQDEAEDNNEIDDDGYKPKDSDNSDSSSESNYTDISDNANAGHIAP